MANPRKPTQLKGLANTKKPCRETAPSVEFDPLDQIPDPPDWMPNAHAVKEFNRLAKILHANKILTEADVTALAHAAAQHGVIVQMYAANVSPTASQHGQLRGYLNDLGLTPVARGKVRPAEAGKPDNPFASNGRPKGK